MLLGHARVHSARIKDVQILLSDNRAGQGRTVKQEQEEIFHNHVQTFILGSALVLTFQVEASKEQRDSTGLHGTSGPQFNSCVKIWHSLDYIYGQTHAHLQIATLGSLAALSGRSVACEMGGKKVMEE